ncbi:hypothetical protein [uncultured Nitrospira sp.]|uniref:hypothetical protein n=1 Tax=uncultured Nitrospira sp. TaxID=157176 RepID=UPI0031403E61
MMHILLANPVLRAVLVIFLVPSALPAQASVPDETTTITLDQAVHFIGTDGSDVVATPGNYSVEAAQEWLRLIPGTERRDALLIEAQPGTHDVKVEIPIVLSTPGSGPDELDVHVVQLLNPDGTSLMATGTYSGIRSRGVMDAAKQAADRARAAAEAARRAAADKAKQTADAARIAALNAKKAAEQVTQDLSTTLLTATNKLRSDLIPLIQCLDAARGHARANLLGYVDLFQRDPGGFSQWLLKDQMDQMQANFSHTMGPALQMLRNGMNQPPQAGLIIDMAFDSWERLASTHPGARCLSPLLNKPRPALKNAAYQLQNNLHTQMQSLFDTHIAPALHEAIGKGLTRILTSQDRGVLLSEEELKAVANGVFAKYLIRQLQNGSNAIQAFTKALGNPGARTAAVTQVQQALHPQAQWPELFRLELGAEIIRAMGHKYIDSDRPGHGGFLVNEAVGLIQLSEGTVEKVSSALCGLVPEVGAAVCAVVEEALDAVWNQGLVPLIRWGATTGLHTGYNQTMDQGKIAIQQGKLPRDIRGQTPHLQGILNVLSKDLLLHVADTNLKETRDALDIFNGSVTQLAIAVNSR